MATRRYQVNLLFELRDLWVGVYWDRPHPMMLRVFLCIVPCLPIRCIVTWAAKGGD